MMTPSLREHRLRLLLDELRHVTRHLDGALDGPPPCPEEARRLRAREGELRRDIALLRRGGATFSFPAGRQARTGGENETLYFG